MVLNSEMVLRVAHVSGEMWQYLSCVPSQERMSRQQLLDVVCCLPLQQLGRLAICLWTFLCLPPPDSFYSYSYYDSSDSDSDSDSDHHHQHAADASASSPYYHSHSD
ncbi:hypothetical protein EZV62_001642 [Acer yangbiense]|uniref:Uncharacterized protein n=1 Tax=Acer yangbiense TaxID=1000413 RepID=A0A5C7GPQ8_9ROSI|nr:hypothetical protein EZV62_028208 [Acer yangbiense]TXG73063.1 hypothetical protein EZV62_001642 [Acer yangbiense]